MARALTEEENAAAVVASKEEEELQRNELEWRMDAVSIDMDRRMETEAEAAKIAER